MSKTDTTKKTVCGWQPITAVWRNWAEIGKRKFCIFKKRFVV